MDLKGKINDFFKKFRDDLVSAVIWAAFSIICGIVTGLCGTGFAKLIVIATDFRLSHEYILFFLPFAGLFIAWVYKLAGSSIEGGTNLVLKDIREGEEVPMRMAPVIFIATVTTHLFGGSVGREGAALQMGGSMGSGLAKFLHMKKDSHQIAIMCGMSAAFSALFGTPLAAMVLPIEISTVGIIHYSALVPCAIASLSAHFVAKYFGMGGGVYNPDLSFGAETPPNILLCIAFAVLAAFVSVLFAVTVNKAEHLAESKIKNDYVRIFVLGAAVVGMTLLVGSQTYNGTGAATIYNSVFGNGAGLPWYAFLLKIIFTAVTLAAGFKGGEIVPALFIGATFGNFFGTLTGTSPATFAAIGMGAVFCGITNCPLASLLLCFELNGYGGIPYYMIAIPLTFLLSGNFGVYKGQKILYSKYSMDKIDEHTK